MPEATTLRFFCSLGPAVLACLSAGCGILDVGSDESSAGVYTDYDALSNAELLPRPVISGRYIHLNGTNLVLSVWVDCRSRPFDSVRTFELLVISREVDVREWIRYHHADFGNEYSNIEPERVQLISGSVRLEDVRVDASDPESARISFRVTAERMLFEPMLHLPPLRTERHACFADTGLGAGS